MFMLNILGLRAKYSVYPSLFIGGSFFFWFDVLESDVLVYTEL